MKLILSTLLMASLLFLSGCQQETKSSVMAEPVPVIDQKNAKAFLKKLAEDYLILANALKAQSVFYENNNDLDGFIAYRNKDWTPNYASRKLFYEETLKQNHPYLSQHKLEKPFNVFSSLIYVGLDIKHDLQKSDNKALNKDYKQLETDLHYMQRVKDL
jgi:hypothetical protein